MKNNRWINITVLFVFALGSFGVRSAGNQSAAAAPLADEILYVKPDSSGEEDCSTWADACELQDALEASEYGDQIWVASGIYTPTYQTDTEDPLSATFIMESGVALYGGFTGSESELSERDWESNITVLSGDLDGNDIIDPSGVITETANIVGSNATRVIISEGVTETAKLDGFIVTGGSGTGGMYNYESSPTLTNLTFKGNRGGEYGGGVSNWYSNPKLTNVIFSGNHAMGYIGVNGGGGGMANYESNPVLTDVTFSGNSSGVYGGGMLNEYSDPVLIDVIFSINTSPKYGSGMYNVSSNPVLSGVNFNNNTTTSGGGGMYNTNSNPELAHVIFDGNRTDYPGCDGGGIYNLSSTPVLSDVTFMNNYALCSGGGMYNLSSSPVMTDVVFSSNTTGGMVGGGGGISNSGSSPLLTNVTFYDNYSFYGGGIYNSSSSNPVLTNVIFNGNHAQDHGGGMLNTSSTPELYNVIFSGNTALNGGGIWNSGGSPLLVNVSISGNHAGSRGGGIYNTGSNPIITNTILWGNTADETSLQIFNENNSIPVIRYSDIEGGCELSIGNDCSGGGNIDADPLFVRNPDPGPDGIWGYGEDDFGDLRLGPLSPAIDAGDNTAVPTGVTTDLDGSPRFVDIPGAADTGNGTAPIVDMGAYEAVNLAPTAVDDPDYSTDNITPLLVDAPGVLENDSDPNLDPLSAEIGDNPSIGDLTLNPDGSFEYLPETEYTGIVTFTYQATDGLLASLLATVTITIEQGQRTIYLPLITHE